MLNHLLRNCVAQYNNNCRKKLIYHTARFCNENIHKSDFEEETNSREINTNDFVNHLSEIADKINGLNQENHKINQVNTTDTYNKQESNLKKINANDLLNHITKLSDEINSLKQEKSHKIEKINATFELRKNNHEEFKVVSNKLIKNIESLDSDRKKFKSRLKIIEDKIDNFINQIEFSKYDKNINISKNVLNQESEETMNDLDEYSKNRVLDDKTDASVNQNKIFPLYIDKPSKCFSSKEQQLIIVIKGLNSWYIRKRVNPATIVSHLFYNAFGFKDIYDQLYLLPNSRNAWLIFVKLKDMKTKEYILKTQHEKLRNPNIEIEPYCTEEEIFYKKFLSEIESERD